MLLLLVLRLLLSRQLDEAAPLLPVFVIETAPPVHQIHLRRLVPLSVLLVVVRVAVAETCIVVLLRRRLAAILLLHQRLLVVQVRHRGVERILLRSHG